MGRPFIVGYGGIDHDMTAFFPRSRHQQHTPIVELNPHVAVLNAVPQPHYPLSRDSLENPPPQHKAAIVTVPVFGRAE